MARRAGANLEFVCVGDGSGAQIGILPSLMRSGAVQPLHGLNPTIEQHHPAWLRGQERSQLQGRACNARSARARRCGY